MQSNTPGFYTPIYQDSMFPDKCDGEWWRAYSLLVHNAAPHRTLNMVMKAHSLFWAKTLAVAASAPDIHPAFKPVGHHLLDVAAVARRYLDLNPQRLRRESALTGLAPEQHARLCTLLAALHDLGKISPWFQAQAVAHWPFGALGNIPVHARRISHWEATAVLLGDSKIRQMLAAALGGVLDPQIVAAVAGHHGRAPSSDYFEEANSSRLGIAVGEDCLAVARELCEEIISLLLPEPLACAEWTRADAFSFSLNGLITLADWIGSDVAHFPFEPPEMPLEEYWPLAIGRAEDALRAKGLVPACPQSTPTLSLISAQAGASPRPMQALVGKLDIGDRPQLILIEDGTGSGKTEAALLLAARMIAAGLGEGIYVALPTMATANAMYERLEAAIGGLFDETNGLKASLVLAHAKASVASALDRLSAAGDVGGGLEETVSQRFNAWIADSRKKAFLADAGAGTIDQAFLAVLPKKHLTLRQYALAGRILIIDEAHACDPYMGEELKVLVEMQAKLGGSVIILSATLAQSQRRDQIQAFARGLGLKRKAMLPLERAVLSDAYPLLTRYAGGADIEEIPIEPTDRLARSVGIARLPDRAASIELALDMAAHGACVAIICNAVDSAIEVYASLLQAGHASERLTLFHARFATGHRMGIEEKVLQLFGVGSRPETRAGQILIATQVVEQSLDLDFDVMISDLAPVDLLIQRAGRLWRHRRSGRPVAEPILHILSPDPGRSVDGDWLMDTLGSAAHTYDLPGVLWRTARDLFARGRLDMPTDLRRLVEAAYRPDDDDLPEGLIKPHQNSVGKEYAARFQGQHNTIDPRGGYAGVRSVSADEEVGTRLGEKSITLRLARRSNSGLVPLVSRQGAPDAVNWMLSEVSVRYRWLAGKGGVDSPIPAPADQACVDATRATWPEWERGMPLYEVGENGILRNLDDGKLVYNSRTGLHRMRCETEILSNSCVQ